MVLTKFSGNLRFTGSRGQEDQKVDFPGLGFKPGLNDVFFFLGGGGMARVTELGSFMVPIGLHHWLGFGGGQLRRLTPPPRAVFGP